MDEILASIRRIIESGEDRNPADPKLADDRGAARTAGSASGSGSDDVEAGSAAVASAHFDVHYLPSGLGVASAPETGMDAPADAGRERDDAPHAVRVDSADRWGADDGDAFGSRNETAYDRPEADDGRGSAEFEAIAPLHQAGNENGLREDDGASSATAVSPTDFAFEFDDAQFEADLRNGGWSEPDASEQPSVTDVDSRVPEPANSQARRVPESVIDGASALLSAEAGSQVAVAFGDLARAIREGHMRSMEEMAREMLRPMLQEWLDDNLPRIVERLVREEIERVARGARY